MYYKWFLQQRLAGHASQYGTLQRSCQSKYQEGRTYLYIWGHGSLFPPGILWRKKKTNLAEYFFFKVELRGVYVVCFFQVCAVVEGGGRLPVIMMYISWSTFFQGIDATVGDSFATLGPPLLPWENRKGRGQQTTNDKQPGDRHCNY